MSDTRALLNRVAEFRKRLDAMPRLFPGPKEPPLVEPAPASEPKIEAGSRTQAVIEDSVRQLNVTKAEAKPKELCDRARRLLIEAHALVTKLKVVADEPLLAGSPGGAGADVIAIHFRETAAMTEAVVRYARGLPEARDEQHRLCEGLEGMVDAARRRFALLAGAIERRRMDARWVDGLALFLTAMGEATGAIDHSPVIELGHELLAEERGKPLRLLSAEPLATTGYIGGPSYSAPARFVAVHGINCAKVMVRLIQNDAEWRGREIEPILAALLHDVGMVQVDADALAMDGPLDVRQRCEVEAHAVQGAEIVAQCLPTLGSIVEITATHHEREDGSGYPWGLKGEQISPLGKLVAVVDVYAALCTKRPHRAALDPRTALAETLLEADRGSLDRFSADKLCVLGFYPPGTVVELANGSSGLVLASRDPRVVPHLASRPLVAMLADDEGHALPTPRYVDLADADSEGIVRSLDPLERLTLLGRAYPDWI